MGRGTASQSREVNPEHMLYVLASSVLGASGNGRYFITLRGGGLRSSEGKLFPWTEWCIGHLVYVDGAVAWDRNTHIATGRLQRLVGNLGGWAGEWQTSMAGAEWNVDD